MPGIKVIEAIGCFGDRLRHCDGVVPRILQNESQNLVPDLVGVSSTGFFCTLVHLNNESEHVYKASKAYLMYNRFDCDLICLVNTEDLRKSDVLLQKLQKNRPRTFNPGHRLHLFNIHILPAFMHQCKIQERCKQ